MKHTHTHRKRERGREERFKSTGDRQTCLKRGSKASGGCAFQGMYVPLKLFEAFCAFLVAFCYCTCEDFHFQKFKKYQVEASKCKLELYEERGCAYFISREGFWEMLTLKQRNQAGRVQVLMRYGSTDAGMQEIAYLNFLCISLNVVLNPHSAELSVPHTWPGAVPMTCSSIHSRTRGCLVYGPYWY